MMNGSASAIGAGPRALSTAWMRPPRGCRGVKPGACGQSARKFAKAAVIVCQNIHVNEGRVSPRTSLVSHGGHLGLYAQLDSTAPFAFTRLWPTRASPAVAHLDGRHECGHCAARSLLELGVRAGEHSHPACSSVRFADGTCVP
eukprot:scaffold5310_cov114-Isochrysis_galbana.AAC.2